MIHGADQTWAWMTAFCWVSMGRNEKAERSETGGVQLELVSIPLCACAVREDRGAVPLMLIIRK